MFYCVVLFMALKHKSPMWLSHLLSLKVWLRLWCYFCICQSCLLCVVGLLLCYVLSATVQPEHVFVHTNKVFVVFIVIICEVIGLLIYLDSSFEYNHYVVTIS